MFDFQCVPATVDFGILVVGEMASDTVSLHNPHSCTTEYKLTFEYEGLDKCRKSSDYYFGLLVLDQTKNTQFFADNLPNIPPTAVKLDKMYGSLTAYGKEELHLTYKPTSCADYKIKVTVQVITSDVLVLLLCIYFGYNRGLTLGVLISEPPTANLF